MMLSRSLYVAAVQACLLLLCTQLLANTSEAFKLKDAVGEWSQWSQWTPCSAQCRTGISVRSRTCQQSLLLPLLSSGNAKVRCPGGHQEIKVCNKQECRGGGKGWREEECSKYDSSLHSGRQYSWEPFTHPSEPCSLTCRAKGHHFYTTLTDTVVDGTPCGGATVNPSAICLKGVCQEVGCDDMVGSPWRRDACGVCRGNNTTCRAVSGVFSEQPERRGMQGIVRIPSGATLINITGLHYSVNWLALQNEPGDYILNGGEMKSPAGDYEAAGTIFSYQTSQRCSGQCITAHGPINQPVKLMINIRGTNRGVQYSFNVPLDVKDDYFRRIIDPTADPDVPLHETSSSESVSDSDESESDDEEDFIADANNAKNDDVDDRMVDAVMESVDLDSSASEGDSSDSEGDSSEGDSSASEGDSSEGDSSDSEGDSSEGDSSDSEGDSSPSKDEGGGENDDEEEEQDFEDEEEQQELEKLEKHKAKVFDQYPPFDEGDDLRFGQSDNDEDNAEDPSDDAFDDDDISLDSDDNSMSDSSEMEEEEEKEDSISRTPDDHTDAVDITYHRENDDDNDGDEDGDPWGSDVLADDSDVGAPEPLLLSKPGDIIRKSEPEFIGSEPLRQDAFMGSAKSSERASVNGGESDDNDDDDDDDDLSTPQGPSTRFASTAYSSEESDRTEDATSPSSDRSSSSSTSHQPPTTGSQHMAIGQHASTAVQDNPSTTTEHTVATQERSSSQHTTTTSPQPPKNDTSLDGVPREASKDAVPMDPSGSYSDQARNDARVTPGHVSPSPNHRRSVVPPPSSPRRSSHPHPQRDSPTRLHPSSSPQQPSPQPHQQQQHRSRISDSRRLAVSRRRFHRPSYSQSFTFRRRRRYRQRPGASKHHSGDVSGRDSRPQQPSRVLGSRRVVIRVPPRRHGAEGRNPYEHGRPSPDSDRQALTLGHSTSRDQDGFLTIHVGGGDSNNNSSNPSPSPSGSRQQQQHHSRHDRRRHPQQQKNSRQQWEYARQQEGYRREMQRRRQQMEQQRAAQQAEYQRRLEEHQRKVRQRQLEVQRRQQQHNNGNHHQHRQRHHHNNHNNRQHPSHHQQHGGRRPEEDQDRRQDMNLAVPLGGRVIPGYPLSGNAAASSSELPSQQSRRNDGRESGSVNSRLPPSRVQQTTPSPLTDSPTPPAPASGYTRRDYLANRADEEEGTERPPPTVPANLLPNAGGRGPDPPRFVPEDSRLDARSGLHGPHPSSSSNEVPNGGVITPLVIGPEGNNIVPTVNERGMVIGGEGSLRARENLQGNKMSYEWRVSGLTQCTLTCGGGVQQTAVVCLDTRTQAVVTNGNCAHVPQPQIKTVTCNTRPCPAEWQSSPWSACSVSCGSGDQTRVVTCTARISPTLNLTRPEEHCQGSTRPESRRRCQSDPCTTWKTGNWSQCSGKCGEGVRTRDVFCADQTGYDVSDDLCARSKPEAEEACETGPCGQGWYYTEWPECPAQCGSGTMSRRVTCVGEGGRGGLPEASCQGVTRPDLQQPCRASTPCGGQWFTGEWTQCNVTCGQGHQNREALCIKTLPGGLLTVVGEENCDAALKPETLEPCQLDACAAEWYITSWKKCSKSCGTGQRMREVKCLDSQQRASSDCPLADKPRSRETCNTHPCAARPTPAVAGSAGSADCQDSFVRCEIVRHARMCRYPFYKKKCCVTCRQDT